MNQPMNERLTEQYMSFFTTLYATTRLSTENQSCLKAYSRGFYVLFTLKYHPDPHLTLSQLSKELLITKQQLTKLINDLEEKHLVRRYPHPTNRRSTILKLTLEGEQTLEHITTQTKQQLMPKFEIYTKEEQEQLYHCMSVCQQLLQKQQPYPRKKRDDISS